MEGIRNALGRTGGADRARSSSIDLTEGCGSLSYKNRLVGFGVCFILGWFITFLSLLTMGSIVTSPARFATLYTLGNITAIASTFFIYGPVRQAKTMMKQSRWIATIIYVLFMVLTLFAAFKPDPKPGVIILAVIGQFLASLWYSLSFIPFARDGVKRVLGL